MNNNLGTIKKIDLRKIFKEEARDFTPWLAQEDNLRILSEEIGVEIKLTQVEANVGSYNVDILAEEEGTGRKIIIENQLESSNHDHLGKIITYASGHDANIVIWIFREIKEEHRQAIDWLNEHTDEDLAFFALKIELWQINDSLPAPKFEIICNPNEWAKTVKHSVGSSNLTDTKLQQLEFWTRFKNYVQERDHKIRLQTPRPQNWYDVSIGSAEAHIALTINSQKNLLGCEIYISKNKELFTVLKSSKDEIEKEIGEKMDWFEANVASGIKIKKQVNNLFEKSAEEQYFIWLYEKTILFQNVFTKYFSEYKQ